MGLILGQTYKNDEGKIMISSWLMGMTVI
ncbi:uncharacterized protein G2W53_030743 [Senna tora]|uniref:Uncharacterized protein n=1 Tax=Senna tora TaxID=362788 RepID=A0A834T707_9FABA|nr:uncharacterized protein G2W53_030743 [Senna tora]